QAGLPKGAGWELQRPGWYTVADGPRPAGGADTPQQPAALGPVTRGLPRPAQVRAGADSAAVQPGPVAGQHQPPERGGESPRPGAEGGASAEGQAPRPRATRGASGRRPQPARLGPAQGRAARRG